MKWNRGLWAGACLFLFLSGCSDDGDGNKVKDGGVYSPIITGIKADNEPAVRGLANTFTVLVTNVNGYALTYHWSAAAGTLTDSTHATASWTAPDSIGTYPVTVSIQAQDPGGKSFFQTTTFQVFVDNDYTRWTSSPEVQFDPDALPSGGVIFAQMRDISTGAADVYSTTVPGMAPVQLTTGFATLTSPSMRADGQQIAVAGKATSAEGGPSIWVLPGAGGDASTAQVVALRTASGKPGLYAPRFARAGNWLFYSSDSSRVGNPRPWFQDAFNLLAPAEPVIETGAFLLGAAFYQAAMGPDLDANGLPDSVVCPSYRFFGLSNQQARGLFKFATRPPQNVGNQWLADSAATELDWSPDGQHIIYARRNPLGDRDIWIINAGSMDPATARRVTFGPADDSHPRFTPDGVSIVFVSNRADHYGLNGIYNTERRGTNIWSVARFDRP